MRGQSTWTTKVLVVTLAIAVAGSTMAIATRGDDYRFFDPLIDVKTIIDRYAVEPPDAEELQRAAIEGMLEALDDPYAVYVPAENEADFNQQITGEYVGIGAEVLSRNGALEIITPLDGSPAFRAGLLSGDRVLAIDGGSTAEETTQASIDRIKGEAGTDVVLTVERGGETFDITITRAEIKTPAVRGFHRIGDDDSTWDYLLDPVQRIAYVRLTQFTPSCAAEFERALKTAESQAGGSLAGLIIDVRFNPGGVLEQAVRIADLFLSEGTVVSTRGPAHPEIVATANDDPSDRAFPIAVLINEQSASASEVLAGALTENNRAIAVGTRSFGKGSVQAIRALGGTAAGSVLKLTEQRYYLPTGRSIQRLDGSAEWGVDPTPGFYAPMTEAEIRDMLAIWRQEEIIGNDDDQDREWSDPDRIAAELEDPQLAVALRALHERIATGEWVPQGEQAPAVDPAVLDELASARRARERLLRELTRIDRRIDTMQSAASEDPDAVAATEIDLVPDDAELVGGEIDIRDATGKVVARLRITGSNIERWLIDAGVEPLEEPAPADAP